MMRRLVSINVNVKRESEYGVFFTNMPDGIVKWGFRIDQLEAKRFPDAHPALNAIPFNNQAVEWDRYHSIDAVCDFYFEPACWNAPAPMRMKEAPDAS